MAKYLCEVHYTADGIQGVIADGASRRKAAVDKAVKSLGGRVEAFYFCFGDRDAILILDMPNPISAAALSLVVGSSGLVHVTVTPLLTIADVDKAVRLHPAYAPPGSGRAKR